MNIELKKIKIASSLSEETIAFTADLYIDGKHIGYAKNTGHGGETMVMPVSAEYYPIIKNAEQYCLSLPPEPSDYGGSLPMSLDFYIDLLVEKVSNDKEKVKFKKKMERDMEKGILVGNDDSYSMFCYQRPLHQIISRHSDPVAFINKSLANIVTKLKPGERILNTNFPAGVVIPQPVNA